MPSRFTPFLNVCIDAPYSKWHIASLELAEPRVQHSIQSFVNMWYGSYIWLSLFTFMHYHICQIISFSVGPHRGLHSTALTYIGCRHSLLYTNWFASAIAVPRGVLCCTNHNRNNLSYANFTILYYKITQVHRNLCLSPRILKWKVGCPITILRAFDPPRTTKGTWHVFSRLHSNVIEAVIWCGETAKASSFHESRGCRRIPICLSRSVSCSFPPAHASTWPSTRAKDTHSKIADSTSPRLASATRRCIWPCRELARRRTSPFCHRGRTTAVLCITKLFLTCMNTIRRMR